MNLDVRTRIRQAQDEATFRFVPMPAPPPRPFLRPRVRLPRISALGLAFVITILYFAVEIIPAFMAGGPVQQLKAQQETRSCAGSATPELQADCVLRAEGAK